MSVFGTDEVARLGGDVDKERRERRATDADDDMKDDRGKHEQSAGEEGRVE